MARVRNLHARARLSRATPRRYRHCRQRRPLKLRVASRCNSVDFHEDTVRFSRQGVARLFTTANPIQRCQRSQRRSRLSLREHHTLHVPAPASPLRTRRSTRHSPHAAPADRHHRCESSPPVPGRRPVPGCPTCFNVQLLKNVPPPASGHPDPPETQLLLVRGIPTVEIPQ